jgi:hypothetical protein
MWVKVLIDDLKLDGKAVAKGEVVNAPAGMAAHLCDAGQAEPAEPPKSRRIESTQPDAIAAAQDEPERVERVRAKK